MERKNLPIARMKMSPLIIFLLASATACSANKNIIFLSSKKEAVEKCTEWANQGTTMSFERELSYLEKEKEFELNNPKPEGSISLRSSTIFGNLVVDRDLLDWFKDRENYTDTIIKVKEEFGSRFCKVDDRRNQTLGYENQAIKDGSYKDEEGRKGEPLIVKHFRFLDHPF